MSIQKIDNLLTSKTNSTPKNSITKLMILIFLTHSKTPKFKPNTEKRRTHKHAPKLNDSKQETNYIPL